MSHWGYVIEQMIQVDERSVGRERRRLRRRTPKVSAVAATTYEISCARAASQASHARRLA